MSEARLDLMIKGKKKTFVQDHIPYRKALDYTKGESELWGKDKFGTEIQPKQFELDEYRVRFVASIFDDEDVTVDAILDGLDASEAPKKISDIIMYRVLGYKEKFDDDSAPNETKKQ
ncbi:hypothetical protein IGI37_000105 [Enterococcus sp. AZ194]|uniref:phage tail assembly chaperone G n=1 Tax=Enterococcus sp. AZ194 TaxID=2774629 RepID=UPI003F2779FC